MTALAQLAPSSDQLLTHTAPQAKPANRAALDRARLRQLAAASEPWAGAESDLSALWRELSRGSWRIFDSFHTEEHAILLLQSNEAPGAALEGRQLEIIEAVLRGTRQKTIAIEMRLAPSTIAMHAQLALARLGLRCRSSRAHPLLMMAAVAASTRDSKLVGHETSIELESLALRVVAVRRPDIQLREQLPSAEAEVVSGLIEGASHREIAVQRGKSVRTVANQIAAVFHRLKVSGRNDLVLKLLGVPAQTVS